MKPEALSGVSADAGQHILRRDQLDLMPRRRQFQSPMIGTATRLCENKGSRLASHKKQKPATRQFLAELQLADHRRAVKLENILCQVNSNHCILHLPSSLLRDL